MKERNDQDQDVLFHAEMVNATGITGNTYVKGGLAVALGETGSGKGTNPEELLGMAWATCLNATLQSMLKGRGIQAKSKVEVHVDLKREQSGSGFYFALKAMMAIEGMEHDTVLRLASWAHRRCPVSKIIGDYEHVQIEVVPYS